MNIKFILIILPLFTTLSGFGQFSQKHISTDSSEIEITRNSVYKIYEETYKNRDSIWYSVQYIKDTTQVNIQGWKTKDNERFGIWKEYTIGGELLYTRNYDFATCNINEELFPYHEILERIKKKADSLIIATYSQKFFNKHVRFEFNCYAYDENGYVGSWTEPMKRKPTEFLFRYAVRLNENTEWQSEMIGLKLDENGNYIPSHDRFNNNGFEKLNSESRTYKINREKAICIAKNKGLEIENPNKVFGFLTWESFDNATFYNGQFRYYIAEFTDKIEDINKNGRSRIVYKYNVYTFNPWTGKFLEMKKMKKVRAWEENSGFTSGLMPDK